MNRQNSHGFNALAWVKHEIDHSLDQARNAINAYAASPGQTQHLSRALSLLRDVQGTLDVAELEGAAMLANESVEVVKALEEKTVSNVEEACKHVIRALIQLPDYLDYVQSGQEDTPLVLVSVVNDLRAVRKAEFVSEGLGDIAGLEGDARLLDRQPHSGEDLRSIAELTRLVFELGLLGWYRNSNVQESLGKMALVCRRLRLASNHRASRRLWWTAEALTEALQTGRLQSSDAIKTLLGRVDREIKRLFKVGEDAFSATIPLDLVKSLLYYIAAAKPGNAVVDEVRSAYFLDDAVPPVESLEGYQDALSGHNQSLQRSVALSLSEDLDEIREHLARFDVEARPAPGTLDVLVALFSRLKDTFDTLGQQPEAGRAEEIRSMLSELRAEQRLPDREALERVARSVIEFQQSAGRFGVRRGSGGDEASTGAQTIQPSDDAFREVRSVVIKEVLEDINHCKARIQRYANGQCPVSDLEDTLDYFSRVAGAMALLSLESAGELVSGIHDYLAETIETASDLNGSQLDYLAETIAAVEVFLEILDASHIEQPSFIETGMASLNILKAVQAEPVEMDESTAFLADVSLTEAELTMPDAAPEASRPTESGEAIPEGEEQGTVIETAQVEEIRLEGAEMPAVVKMSGLAGDALQDEETQSGSEKMEPAAESADAGEAPVDAETATDAETGELSELVEPTAGDVSLLTEGSMPIPDVGELPEFQPPTDLTLATSDGVDDESAETVERSSGPGESLVEMPALDTDLLDALDDASESFEASELIDLHELAATLTDSDGAVTDFEFDASLIDSLQEQPLDDVPELGLGAAGQSGDAAPAAETPEPAAQTKLGDGLAESFRGLEVMDETTDQEIYQIFLDEFREETAALEDNFPRWMADRSDEDALVQSRRAFHTIKGSGRLIGAQIVGEFAWLHEKILNQVIDKTLTPTPELVACVQEGVALLPRLAQQLEAREQPDQAVNQHAMWAERIANGQFADDWKAADVETGAPEVAAQEEPEELVEIEALPTMTAIEPLEATLDELEQSFEFEPELMNVFVTDARHNLQVISERIPGAEEAGEWRPSESLLIAVHTLNGSARTAGIDEISHPFGACEHYFRNKQEREMPLDEEDAAALRSLVEHARQVLEEIERQSPRSSGMALERIFQARIAMMEQAEAEQAEAEQAEAEQAEAEQAEAEQAEAEQAEAEQAEAEQAEAEQAEAEQAEAERAEAEQAETDQTLQSLGEESRSPVAEMMLPAVDLPGATPAVEGSATQLTELVEVFLDECQELLESCDEAMARWEKAPDDLAPVNEIKRDLHTLKGSARMAGISEIGNLSHAMETLLGDITSGEVEVGHDIFPVVHGAFDKINALADEVRGHRELSSIAPVVALLEKVRAGEKPNEEDFRQLSAGAEPPAEIRAVETPSQPPEPAAPPVLKEIKGELDLPGAEIQPQVEAAPRLQESIKISAELLDRLVDNIGEVNVFHSRVEQQVGSFDFNLKELDQTIRRVTEQLRRLELEAEAQILHRNKGMPLNPDDSVVGKQFDPLELDRYSKLQQLSRSLAESTSDLKNIHQLLADEVTGLDKILQQQARVSNELQEGLMRTRMSRFKVMAPRLRRVVRRTAMDLGKEVELDILGDNAELDRKMLESIVVPLEHLLRNAIAHGIEPPEQREAMGKPREGKIVVSIRREGPQIAVSVKDDGAGVNRDKVIARALENGLISEGETLSPSQINKLILQPGFSTADEVSQVAGRGVGMDVVMTQLKQLNGVLEIESEPGKGSEFRISIPFTLAINMALLIVANKGQYAVPMGAIDGVLQIPGKSLAEKMTTPGATISYADAEYRLHSLPSVLEKIAPPALNDKHVYPVLLGRSGAHRVAFIADEILGNREIVVKPVGPLLGALECISGATILGDGEIVLILDIAGLVRQTLEDQEYIEAPVQEEEEKQTLVMVVDDSITIRKVTSRMLERKGYAVVTAKDGLDAIAQLQEISPDIMLLDIEMPRMDGFELAEHVRNSQENADLPIIMISSRTGKKHRDRATQLGVNRFLGKPYQDQELLDNINALLDGEKNGSTQPLHQ